MYFLYFCSNLRSRCHTLFLPVKVCLLEFQFGLAGCAVLTVLVLVDVKKDDKITEKK